MSGQKYGMVFHTQENNYYYDTATGKVVSCDDSEIEIVERVLSGESSIEIEGSKNKDFEEFIKRENLFDENKSWKFIIPTRVEFEELIKGKCEQIVLELTEACNLRCGYCIYNDHHPDHRSFSNKHMTFDIAKRSIDYVMHDYTGDEFALTFYGGEPLVEYELMKKTIEYFRDSYPDVKKSFGFTTNLTLLDDEMIDYFSKIEELEIVCSIDGPQEYHDKYRRDVMGIGSHEMATANFKTLVEKFYNPQAGRTLMINCVITPPYTKDRLERISAFFRESLSVPKEININYSYVDVGDMVFDYDRDEEIEKNPYLELSPLEGWAAEDFERNGTGSEYFGLIDKELARVSGRMRSEDVVNGSYLHGNCLPGQRRLYVTTEGKFRTCEKVGSIPSLGDCFDGYDYDTSYDIYIENYARQYHERCSDCWARTMCAVCYENSVTTDSSKLYEPEGMCETSKQIVHDMFVNYFTLYEKDPEGLKDAMSEIEFR